MKKTCLWLVSAVLGVVVVGQVFAETEVINPVEVKTRRLTVYGTNPMKIGSTEITEANITAVQTGGTLPAVNGAAVTALSAANITAGGTITPINGNSITNLNAANIRAGTTVSAVNGASITNINAANVSGTYGAGSGAALTSLTAANVSAGALNAAMTLGAYAPIVFNSTSKQMIQHGSATTAQTVAFSPVFTGAANVTVFVSPTASSTLVPYASSVTSTNFVMTGDVGTSPYNWIAIGTTP